MARKEKNLVAEVEMVRKEDYETRFYILCTRQEFIALKRKFNAAARREFVKDIFRGKISGFPLIPAPPGAQKHRFSLGMSPEAARVFYRLLPRGWRERYSLILYFVKSFEKSKQRLNGGDEQ